MQSILKNYQIILESIEEGVFTVNQEWRIMSFNRAAEAITGIPRKEAIGRRCSEVFKTNLCETGCILKKTIATGKSISNMPVYITRADKSQIPISVNTAVLKDSKGQMIGGVETFRDLTAFTQLRRAYLKQHTFEDIVSKNETMRRYFSILPQVAKSDSIVLVEGATGTGKELFARAIHNHSHRKNGPFIAVNCGAIPDTLIESELFGYKAGAFTDAKTDKPGRFALAENGTIFLDEIGDISQSVQARLLRVLQEKSYEPLGATQTVQSNARVIVATHRDLEKRVQEGRFREDLYYRINVIRLVLPPVSERKEDLPLLVEHFIRHFNYAFNKSIMGMTQEAMSVLMLHDWPGNVRELENTIEYAFVLCTDSLIDQQHLPDRFHPEKKTFFSREALSLKEAERMTIVEALKRNQWKKMVTARELGIDKNTLRRKIVRYGIEKPEITHEAQ